MEGKRFVSDLSLTCRHVNKQASVPNFPMNILMFFLRCKHFERDFTVRWKLIRFFSLEGCMGDLPGIYFQNLQKVFFFDGKRMKRDDETEYSIWFVCPSWPSFIIKRTELCSWKILFLVAGIFSFLMKMLSKHKAMHCKCKLHLFSHYWQDLTVSCSLFSWTTKLIISKEQLQPDCISFIYL